MRGTDLRHDEHGRLPRCREVEEEGAPREHREGCPGCQVDAGPAGSSHWTVPGNVEGEVGRTSQLGSRKPSNHWHGHLCPGSCGVAASNHRALRIGPRARRIERAYQVPCASEVHVRGPDVPFGHLRRLQHLHHGYVPALQDLHGYGSGHVQGRFLRSVQSRDGQVSSSCFLEPHYRHAQLPRLLRHEPLYASERQAGPLPLRGDHDGDRSSRL
mmetsp:Transcript_64258/g.150653  ORF Transcript_64258/g.150653 Transcript_64258/m.150653 type:complete len:214 (-) Transcript_64258:116-757(-)